MDRETISFGSGSDTCAGWFYPAATQARATIVMAHGLAAVKEMRLDAYAEHFAAAGYHVLVFDYRHFGTSSGQPRQLLDIKRQHQDWKAAVNYARSRADVDPGKIALWGSSFSGGHVVALAQAVGAQAVIAQVPHMDGIASTLALGPVKVVRLMGHALRDVGRIITRRSPHYLPASGAPGDVAIMTAPEAARYLDLVPAGQDFDQRVAARFVLHVGFYSPGRKLKSLQVPVLVQVGEHDQTTPPNAALKHASRGPDVSVKKHDCGHF
ncbi:MAG: alpha/beta hydrolase, partial [Nocardioidaceae bacterium]|nr:alpha/beta hydrolase [Nocardioidaceae bacterium]